MTQQKTILVADDESHILHVVSLKLRNAGYRAGLTICSGLNRPGHDPWCLRRVNVPAQISDVAFEAWTAGFGPHN